MKHTRKQFCEICTIPSRHLSVLISRGTVVEKDKLFDDKNDKNASFIKKQQEKQAGNEKEPVKKESPPEPIFITEEKEKEISTPGTERKNKPVILSQYDLEKKLKEADLEKKEVDIRVALLKEQKLMGEAIPTNLVKNVITVLSKSIVSSFKDGAENLLIQISKRKALTIDEVAELRGLLVNIINSANHKAVEDSKKNIKIIVQEYSSKKSAGEKQ